VFAPLTPCLIFGVHSIPLWNPPSSLCSELTSGNQGARVPVSAARRVGRECQNGARGQGSATPRQNSGAPLPAARRSGVLQLRRAAPAGTRPSARSGFTNLGGRCLSRQRPSSKNQQPDISRANKSGHLDVLITFASLALIRERRTRRVA